MVKVIYKPLFFCLFFYLLIFDIFSSDKGEWNKYLEEDSLKIQIEPIQYFTLKNGIKVYYIENHMLPQINLSFSIDGGFIEEQSEKKGLTQLWGKNIVYSGSPEFPRDKLAEYLEMRASSIVFSANMERVQFNLDSLSSNFEEDLNVFFNIIFNPGFNEEDLNLNKKIALEEIKKRRERSDSMAYLAAQLYEWQGDVRSQIMTSGSITAIGLEDMARWQRHMLNPSRFSLLISGDFSKEKVKLLLNNYLGAKNAELKDYNDSLLKSQQPSKEAVILFQKKEIPQTTIIFRADGIPHSSPDYYAFKIIDHILGGDSFNSYLTREIRTKRGWAYSSYSFYSADRYTGNISLFVQTAKENSVDVIEIIEDILDHPERFLNETALRDAQSVIKNRFVFSFETPEKLASLQLALIQDGLDENYLSTFVDNIEKCNLDNIYRVYKKYYQKENFFISITGSSDSLQTLSKRKSVIHQQVVDFKVPE